MPANLGQPFAQLKLAKHLTYKHMCMSEELSYIDFNMGIFILLKNHYPPLFPPSCYILLYWEIFFRRKQINLRVSIKVNCSPEHRLFIKKIGLPNWLSIAYSSKIYIYPSLENWLTKGDDRAVNEDVDLNVTISEVWH